MDSDCGQEIKRFLLLGRKAMTNVDNVFKRRNNTSLTKVCLVNAMIFPVVMQMWELDHREDGALKNWCFWIVVLDKALESPLDSKEINPVSPKGNQPWIFIGKTDAEATVLGLSDGKSWLTGKDPGAGKDWRQEKRVTNDEMVGWHHRLNVHEFE